MSGDSNSGAKLAFSSQCLPGSPAEQEEKDRLEEFQRTKAIQRAEEEKMKPILAAERAKVHDAAVKANQERIERDRAARAAGRNYR